MPLPSLWIFIACSRVNFNFLLYPCIWLPFHQHKIWLLLQTLCVTSVAILTSCSCSWSCCNCCSFISSWAAKERLLSASSRAWRNRLHLSRSRSSRSVESCCIDASCSRICKKALYSRIPSAWHWWDQACAGLSNILIIIQYIYWPNFLLIIFCYFTDSG